MFDAFRLATLIGLATLVGCANPIADSTAPLPRQAGAVSISPVPARFILSDGAELQFLSMAPESWGLSHPPRNRLYVLPGSGCHGLADMALNYFHGLRHNEVVVLHKRHVDASLRQGVHAACTPSFERADNLARWAEDATAFVSWHMQQNPPRADQPVGLVGISEGAELLAVVVKQVPQAKLLVLLGGSGLDPFEALSLQADKVGAPTLVDRLLQHALDKRLSDDDSWSGRSLGYWRSLVEWRHSQALLEAPQVLWLGFGEQDQSVPLAALQRFVARAKEQKRPMCVVVVNDADHGLQRRGSDAPLQYYWSLVSDALERDDPMMACPTWARH
ncbi:MAG: alpha/beta hydrolase [Burkholderiales bacterium]